MMRWSYVEVRVMIFETALRAIASAEAPWNSAG
jgi:hypothetical protein